MCERAKQIRRFTSELLLQIIYFRVAIPTKEGAHSGREIDQGHNAKINIVELHLEVTLWSRFLLLLKHDLWW